MRQILLPMLAIAGVALAGCDRPASTSSTTVVKEPAVVQKEKETTVVQAPTQPSPPSSSTTIVQPPAPSTSVTIDAGKPESSETTRSRSTTRVDTPMGTATKTESETTKTTR